MPAEWTDQFNPFNSMKALVWSDRFQALARGDIVKPVTVQVDPSNACNLSCEWCFYSDWRQNEKTIVPRNKLLELGQFLVSWGIESCLVNGGGEPFLNRATSELITLLGKGGLETAVITNGTMLDDNDIDAVVNWCRWIGFSVDAANPQSFSTLKGTTEGEFYHLTNTILSIASKKKNSPRIGFKFLLQPKTVNEVYEAAVLAKTLGCDDFQARPIDRPGLQWTDWELQILAERLSMARELDGGGFHVYGVTHKFGPRLEKRQPTKCQVTSMAATTFGADGYVYICCDLRGFESARISTWEELPAVWGSSKHRQVLERLDPTRCPHRCTYQPYQQMLEKVFVEDNMHVRFL